MISPQAEGAQTRKATMMDDAVAAAQTHRDFAPPTGPVAVPIVAGRGTRFVADPGEAFGARAGRYGHLSSPHSLAAGYRKRS